jgi:hypothetical protein
MAYRTEVDALKKQLSAKEEEVLDLSSELSQREQELRLKGKMKEGSPHGEASRKKGSKFGILRLIVGFYIRKSGCVDATPLGNQSLADEMSQVSLSGQLSQRNVPLVRPCNLSELL